MQTQLQEILSECYVKTGDALWRIRLIPKMKRDALAGAPNFIAKPQPKKISASQQKTQSEIAEFQTRRSLAYAVAS